MCPSARAGPCNPPPPPVQRASTRRRPRPTLGTGWPKQHDEMGGQRPRVGGWGGWGALAETRAPGGRGATSPPNNTALPEARAPVLCPPTPPSPMPPPVPCHPTSPKRPSSPPAAGHGRPWPPNQRNAPMPQDRRADPRIKGRPCTLSDAPRTYPHRMQQWTFPSARHARPSAAPPPPPPPPAPRRHSGPSHACATLLRRVPRTLGLQPIPT